MPATINGRMKPWMDRVYNIIKRGGEQYEIKSSEASVTKESGTGSRLVKRHSFRFTAI